LAKVFSLPSWLLNVVPFSNSHFQLFLQAVFWMFTNKVSGHFQKSFCRNTANSSEVVTTCEEKIINGAKVRLLWGVHPISEAVF